MAELKSCPFCGGEASIVSTEPRLYRPSRNGKYAVACYGCEIYLGYDEDYGCQFDTEEEAIEAWNTRKPMELVVAELESKMLVSSSAQSEAIIGMCGASANYYCGEKDAFAKAISIVRGKE